MPKINLQKFNLFSGLNNQELIALDLSTGTLKLVHANSSPNRFEILDLSSRNIADNEEAEIAKSIRAALGEIKFKNPRIVAVVPAHLVITKNIEIPSTNPHEIKEIINLQAGRHTPYSREEIIIDYIEIGTYRRSYTKILLVIVARSAVRRQFQILDKIGIQPEKVLFAPEGVAWAAGRMFNLDTSVFPGCVLNIEESFTDFAIVFKGKIIFIRSVPIGAGHLTAEKDKYRDKFAEEIKRSLEAYQNEDIERSPQGVTLSSSAQDLNYLEPLLSETLRLPVKFFPYLKNVPMSSTASRSASGIINNVS
ncbi:MAG: type IV pilus biogenesis protein PilM, partial [Deltaproteobacteria bacterium]